MAKKLELVVGLDIGTAEVAAVVAEPTEAGTLQIAGAGTAPCDGLRKGVVVNMEATLAPGAAAEAVLTAEQKELGAALIDVGAGTTSVLAFERGAVKHTAVISVGGNHVSSDIAAGLRTPFREAELLN